MTAVPRPAQPINEQVIAALIPPMSAPRPDPAPMPQLAAPVPADSGDCGPVLIATCQPDLLLPGIENEDVAVVDGEDVRV